MERLTIEELTQFPIRNSKKAIKELIEYKKIEQTLGIELSVLVKAFEGGSIGVVYMFVKNDYNEIYKKGLIKSMSINALFRKPNTNNYQLSVLDTLTYKSYIIDLKDYGKTWALTKEELEK